MWVGGLCPPLTAVLPACLSECFTFFFCGEEGLFSSWSMISLLFSRSLQSPPLPLFWLGFSCEMPPTIAFFFFFHLCMGQGGGGRKSEARAPDTAFLISPACARKESVSSWVGTISAPHSMFHATISQDAILLPLALCDSRQIPDRLPRSPPPVQEGECPSRVQCGLQWNPDSPLLFTFLGDHQCQHVCVHSNRYTVWWAKNPPQITQSHCCGC